MSLIHTIPASPKHRVHSGRLEANLGCPTSSGALCPKMWETTNVRKSVLDFRKIGETVSGEDEPPLPPPYLWGETVKSALNILQ